MALLSESATKQPHILQPRIPWFRRLVFGAQILFSRFITTVLLTYLKNHIFHPPVPYPQRNPPLYLDIHGGGFMLLDPSMNNAVNANIAEELNCLVISLDYSKAPTAKFPTAVNEIIDTILDILADETLVFDRSRVVLGGHFAGGTLTISCAQSPRLQSKLVGAISWYPATDSSDDHRPKALLRPCDFPGETDRLISMMPCIKYAYCIPGQDMRDARLSTLFANRTALPKHVMIVGAERDSLAHEAWREARNFAVEDETVDWNDDKDTKYGFEKDGVRFLLVRGEEHGFTRFMGQKGEAETRRKKQEEECWKDVRDWFENGPFAVTQ